MRQSAKSAAGAILVLLTWVGACSALTARSARAATVSVFDNYNSLNCSCGFGDGFFAEEFSPTSDVDFAGAAPFLQNAFRENAQFSMGLYASTSSGVPGSPLWTSGTLPIPPLSATIVRPIYNGPPILLQAGTEYFLVLDIPGTVNPVLDRGWILFGPGFSLCGRAVVEQYRRAKSAVRDLWHDSPCSDPRTRALDLAAAWLRAGGLRHK